MSYRYHKAILPASIMVRVGPQGGKGKGKSSSVVFQMEQQQRKEEMETDVLRNYDGHLWSVCYPEKEDIVKGQNNRALTFWAEEHWTRPYPYTFIETCFDYKDRDSVIEVKTNCYLKYFESALKLCAKYFPLLSQHC
jgi:hypothetical protein